MSIQDDVQRLSGFAPYYRRGGVAVCWYCRALVVADAPYHEPFCAWLAWPRIQRALELSEAVAARWRADIARRDDVGVEPVVRLAHLGLLFRSLDALVGEPVVEDTDAGG